MTRVTFSPVLGQPPLSGFVTYTRAEYSLDFLADSPADIGDRVGEGGVATVLIDDLQISLATQSGQLLFAWGYEYFGRWVAGHVERPDWTEAAVFARDIEPWDPGAGRRVGASPEWSAIYDAESGWVRFFDGRAASASEDRYLIASDTVVGLVGSSLSSLWLRPAFED